MKRAITGVAAVALITVGGVSTSEAFFVKAKNEMNRLNAGRNAVSGKSSAGRDRIDNKNSFNRYNSPDISNSRGVFTGSTGSNVMQSAGQVRDIGNGTAKNARFGNGGGDFKNSGLIGNNAGASQSSGGIYQGDMNSYGHTYMGTDALDRQVRMQELSNQVELKKIEAQR